MPFRTLRLQAITFDCWNTLLYERDPGATHGQRVAALARATGVEAQEAREALDAAWRRHWAFWQEGRGSGAPEIASWALEGLGIEDPERHATLAKEFAEAALDAEVLALDGARATLERLAERRLRRALVCDTGFSPGRVVRQLLDRAGLLELLEVCVFSDEVGVPKPHPRVFEAALAPLGAEARASVHVGDLRRTDVAGGRGFGMGTVRILHAHDDQSELPDADAVARSHAHLSEILGIA